MTGFSFQKNLTCCNVGYMFLSSTKTSKAHQNLNIRHLLVALISLYLKVYFNHTLIITILHNYNEVISVQYFPLFSNTICSYQVLSFPSFNLSASLHIPPLFKSLSHIADNTRNNQRNLPHPAQPLLETVILKTLKHFYRRIQDF